MRQIRNLKFLGYPMVKCDYGFWIHFQDINLKIRVFHGTPGECSSHFEYILRGTQIESKPGLGIVAARNRAERWFRKWASDVGEIAKGKQ